MTDLEHLAQLAYQSGHKALQLGWWGYCKCRARDQGITEKQLLAAIEQIKKTEGTKHE